MPINITGSYKFKKSKKKFSAPLLPGDAILLKQIEQEQAQKRASKVQAQLENLGSTTLEWQKSRPPSNMLDLIHSILERMWTPLPENMQSNTKELIEKGRDAMVPMILTSHLYGIYAHNTTLVDRTLAACQKRSALRVLDVNIPGINELVIENSKIDTPLHDLLVKNPESRLFMAKDLEGYDISELVKGGYLTMDPTRPGAYSIAVPHQGALIKLVMAGRKWIVRTLKATKWKELTEFQLQEKLEKSSGYWKDLYGPSLEWIMYDAVGSGLVDGFDTPMGRGWKLL